MQSWFYIISAAEIESLIAKEILPIRPNRQNERKVKAKSPVSFNYRYD